MSTADARGEVVTLGVFLAGRSAARIRTWTIGTKIRGAAFTLRRKSGPQPAGTWCHGRCAHFSATLPALLGLVSPSRRLATTGVGRITYGSVTYVVQVTRRFAAGASMTVLRRGGHPRLST